MRNRAEQPTNFEELVRALDGLRQKTRRLRCAVDNLHLAFERIRRVQTKDSRLDVSSSRSSGARPAPRITPELIQVLKAHMERTSPPG